MVGPQGVGKTTLAGQLVRGRLGLADTVLGLPIEPGKTRVLYMAMDRPSQVARALRRQFIGDERDILEDRRRLEDKWASPVESTGPRTTTPSS
jgi:replicative DNA helicase